MKKLLLLLIAIVSVSVFGTTVQIGKLYYDLQGSAAAVVKSPTNTAYYRNLKLTSLTIPSKVTYNNKEYTVTEIRDQEIFYGCTTVVSVNIANTVQSLPSQYAFTNCSAMTTLQLSSSLTEIPYYAFGGCTKLSSVTIPNNVTKIGNDAFHGCSKLATVTLGNKITSIGSYAFGYCEKLESIELPSSLTSIGDYAFRNCTTLTNINIPNSVIQLGECAFCYCSSLVNISVPGSIRKIPTGAFSSCTNLSSVTLTEGLDSIGMQAFYNNDALTSVTIPNSATYIGQEAFEYSSNLTSVTIGSGMQKIDSWAFRDCPLTSIYISATTPPTVGVNVPSSAYSTCTIYVPAASVSAYKTASWWQNFNIQALPTYTITWKQDNGSTINTTSVTHGQTPTHADPTKSATAEYSYTFAGWTPTIVPATANATYTATYTATKRSYTITFNNYDNTQLQSSSVEYGTIPSYTGSTPTKPTDTQYMYTFAGWTPEIVPATEDATYTAVYDSIPNKCIIASGTCGANGDNLIWELSCDSVLTISGTGAMENFISTPDSTTKPWKDYVLEIKEIVINTGVTTIGDNAFSNCRNLTSIIIPDGVTSIGESAFNYCIGLVSVTLPQGLTSIGRSAFFYCKSLGGITFPNSITSIGPSAFMSSGLGTATLPNSITKIESSTFCNTLLAKITIPNSVTSIGSNAFEHCTHLDSITIPNSVTSIGTSAFSESGLYSINIPNSITRIESSTFHKTKFTSITIPDSVTSIGSSAFLECSRLKSVIIGQNVTNIERRAFKECTQLTDIYNHAITPQNISSNVFENVDVSACVLHVPCGTLAVYQTADVWKDFGTIIADGCFYAITWQNYDATILQVDSLLEGITPFYSGETPTKPATLEYTYILASWTPEIVPATEDATYTAVFDSTKIEYNVDVTIPDSIESHGSVTIDGEPTYGDTITVTAIPEDGYYFDGWSDGNTDNPREIEITGDTAVYPIFKECEEIIVNISQTINKGQSFTFGGQELTTRGTYRDTVVLANGCDSIVVLKLNVLNSKVKFNLRVVVNDETMGTVSGTGAYVSGSEVTITATPASSKYIFVRWYNEDEGIDVYENPYSFTLTRNLQLRAVFRKAPRRTPESKNTDNNK